MKRLPGWRGRFDAAMDEIRRRPFAWGEHDCAIGLASHIVLAITGKDLAEPYRGRYKTARGAMLAIRKAGFDNLEDAIASLLPEIPVSFATIGDIVTIPVESDFKCSLGVVNGERVFVLRDDGVGTLDLLQAKRAFKVG